MANSSYRNILVPYDDSKYARKALWYAKGLAKSFDSTLYIVTVADISSVVSPGLIKSEDRKALEKIKVSIKQSAGMVVKQKETECMKENIKTKAFVLEGSTTSVLLKLIKENRIDLVVIGSKGLSGVSRIMALGSVSRKISELAGCPVMIVH